MDDAELYGYSLFETLLADQGSFWCLNGHWRRMCAGALYLNMAPPSFEDFVATILEVHDSSQREIIRISLARKGGRWSQQPARDELQALVKSHIAHQSDSVRLMLAAEPLPNKDPLRRFKCGNRLLYQRGYETANAHGFDDCLFFDCAGRLLETAMANIFLYTDQRWITTPLSYQLLPGTMRAYLLRQKYAVAAPFLVNELERVKSAVVSNSVHGCRVVSSLGDRPLNVGIAKAWLATHQPRNFSGYC